jgi:thiamine-phosphate diphosphorylase
MSVAYTGCMLRYAVTDSARFAGENHVRHGELVRIVEKWGASGIDLIQLREKDLDAGELASLARRIMSRMGSGGGHPKLLINSRADVAIAVEADGVHLTSAGGGLTPTQVRSLYADAGLPQPVISVSCHTLQEVAAARDAAVTMILFGPVFEKRVGSQSVSGGTGLDRLRTACRAAEPVPVLALGGITGVNTPACLAAGAAGIAGIRLFTPCLTETLPGE